MFSRAFTLLPLCFSLLLFPCATSGEVFDDQTNDDAEWQSVANLIGNEDFRQENLPIRTLRVAVVLNEDVGDEFALLKFGEASRLLEEQVGIRLDVTLYRGPKWKTNSFFPIHQALREFRTAHSDYDIVFGVSLAYGSDPKPCFFGSCFVGMIDDGRNIALLTLSPTIILHEIGHAFLGIGHSPAGIMKPIPEGKYFSVANREDILRKKWKDFRYFAMESFGN